MDFLVSGVVGAIAVLVGVVEDGGEALARVANMRCMYVCVSEC